jgi:hypothetical protein
MTYWVLQIVGVPGSVTGRITGVLGGGKPGMVGLFVYAFDAEAFGGRGDVSAGPDRAKALRFSDPKDAMLFWRQQSKTMPLRPDGQPNRPLTAFSVDVEAIDEEVSA